ncbi:glycine-rich protein 23-like [Rosa chinensis]|uniref:glycine-rich protein 23-like n=1 Tax=Rosa chinensis TaxID=74649 RepID=UPI000D0917DF|nr:glycine-rich protein 23-like [Rosa chinensis]
MGVARGLAEGSGLGGLSRDGGCRRKLPCPVAGGLRQGSPEPMTVAWLGRFLGGSVWQRGFGGLGGSLGWHGYGGSGPIVEAAWLGGFCAVRGGRGGCGSGSVIGGAGG